MNKTSVSVMEMGRMLGLRKTESYWLIKKGYFEVRVVAGKMRVMLQSFEEWYANQFRYKKVNGDPPGMNWVGKTISIAEASRRLRISRSSVYDIIKTNAFKTQIIDNRIRIDKKSFIKWFNSQTKYPKDKESKRIS